jgi:hypothetical protein
MSYCLITFLAPSNWTILPCQYLFLGERSRPPDASGQALSLDEVHHQVTVACFLKEVGDADQVGMVKVGQDSRFLLELLARLGRGMGVQSWLGGHLFEGEGDVKMRVLGVVDGSYPPLT